MHRNIFKVQASTGRARNRECPVRAVPTRRFSSADHNPAPCLGSGLRVPTVSLLFLVLLLTVATPRLSYAQVQLPAVNLGETSVRPRRLARHRRSDSHPQSVSEIGLAATCGLARAAATGCSLPGIFLK